MEGLLWLVFFFFCLQLILALGTSVGGGLE